jgi:hypothetical protein
VGAAAERRGSETEKPYSCLHNGLTWALGQFIEVGHLRGRLMKTSPIFRDGPLKRSVSINIF